jgi:hypothetical protein
MTLRQEVWDVLVRSVKTFVAAFTATLSAGGLNVTHFSISKQLVVAALAAGATAVLNTGLRVHTAVTNPPAQTVGYQVVTPSVTQSETPVGA